MTVPGERLTRTDEFSTCYWSKNYRACQDLSDLINSGAETSAHPGSNRGRPRGLDVVRGQRSAAVAKPRTVACLPATTGRDPPCEPTRTTLRGSFTNQANRAGRSRNRTPRDPPSGVPHTCEKGRPHHGPTARTPHRGRADQDRTDQIAPIEAAPVEAAPIRAAPIEARTLRPRIPRRRRPCAALTAPMRATPIKAADRDRSRAAPTRARARSTPVQRGHEQAPHRPNAGTRTHRTGPTRRMQARTGPTRRMQVSTPAQLGTRRLHTGPTRHNASSTPSQRGHTHAPHRLNATRAGSAPAQLGPTRRTQVAQRKHRTSQPGARRFPHRPNSAHARRFPHQPNAAHASTAPSPTHGAQDDTARSPWPDEVGVGTPSQLRPTTQPRHPNADPAKKPTPARGGPSARKASARKRHVIRSSHRRMIRPPLGIRLCPFDHHRRHLFRQPRRRQLAVDAPA